MEKRSQRKYTPEEKEEAIALAQEIKGLKLAQKAVKTKLEQLEKNENTGGCDWFFYQSPETLSKNMAFFYIEKRIYSKLVQDFECTYCYNTVAMM